MRLDRTALFAGVSSLEAREALKRVGPWEFSQDAFTDALHTPGDPVAVFREMAARGYIEQSRPAIGTEPAYWRRTDAGNAFCMAAARTITRKAADRLVRELLGRIEALDAPGSPYLYRVKTLDVFGSYTRDTPDLGDVDLVLVLEPKEPDRDRHLALQTKRIDEAMKGGRRFSNLVDELSWPETEVRQYLRAKSGFLRFHRPEDGVIARVKLVRLWPMLEGGPRPLAPRQRSPRGSVTPLQFQALWAVAVGEDPRLAVSEGLDVRRQNAPFTERSTSLWPTIHSLVRRGLLKERPGRHEWRPEYILTPAGVNLVADAASTGRALRLLASVYGKAPDADVRGRAQLILLERALRPGPGKRLQRKRRPSSS